MLVIVALCFANLGFAADDDKPIARWNFEAEEASLLQPHGGVHRDQPGPRPPEFPDFDDQNTAVVFDGDGAYFSFEDSGIDSPFDFTNGDTITLEAWVKVDDLRTGENLYVIGKGRTGAPNFDRDNQNWALRVREVKGKACASFLFATNKSSKSAKSKSTDTSPAKEEAHWHRWTSNDGFEAGSGWHHMAVAYRFGEPDSIACWIDSESIQGRWDMGGPTQDAPIVDNDAIWIGSSQRGSPSNSFRGSLDSIAIHRKRLDDTVLKARFRRVGNAPSVALASEMMPEISDVPSHQTLITFHESMPSHDRWLKANESWPTESDRFVSEAFLLDRLPLRFDDHGIRESWKTPVLVRMVADVLLTGGEKQFLLRARGLSRLWVDGQIVARTKPLTGSPSGEEPITPVQVPVRPGLRLPGYRQQEAIGTAKISKPGWTRVVLETIVGGKKLRPAPGEICVAIEFDDGKSFVLLEPLESGSLSTDATPIVDSLIEQRLKKLEAALSNKDDQRRKSLAASQDDYWKMRHDVAQSLVADNHDPSKSIDSFIADKINQALDTAASVDAETAKVFHESVLPILTEKCFRCHGEKDNGGLRLNSKESFTQGGDSESPAFVPGDVEASLAISRIRSNDENERMPPTGEPLTEDQIASLEKWIEDGAIWAGPPITKEDVALSPIVDDASFLRRVFLDTVGLPPSEQEVRTFLSDRSSDKRREMIDRLLSDERLADHWVSYWQDVLAENPTMINASLNSTGPFRWFLWDSLRDNKPMDRWISELIMLRGSPHDGGSAGFALAAENDAPLAAKGQILASAFLGIELQCARCHDSPYHSTKQKDLYALAAMLDRKTVKVPKTNMVPAAFFEKKDRESLIRATLKPDEPVTTEWPFADVTGAEDDSSLDRLMIETKDTRERLAVLITGPQNTRFPRVIVNRIWRRLVGAGIVEPPQDWEGKQASHASMLDWLAEEFVGHGYDLKHLMRLILNSETYQRAADGYNLAASAESRFFNAPERRRLSAEQILDSLYTAVEATIDVEELTFDPDGRRPTENRLSLGFPKRAWMFASLANERDRPSLSLPKAQAVDDVLTAFGWTGARQFSRTDRESTPNVLQPGVLANSTLSTWITRASDGSKLADLAVEAPSASDLVESLFVRILGRLPTDAESKPLIKALSIGFDSRIIPDEQMAKPESLPPISRVTWSNHLVPEATTIQIEMARRAKIGKPADPRLEPMWRETFEDLVWSLVNNREFVWIP